jgi:hypothetical protein
MRVFRRNRMVAVVAVLALVMLSSGCEYWSMANNANTTGSPWFCNPTAPNSVTGPGMGTVNWYAGVTRAPLSKQDCLDFGAQLDDAKAYASRYPTLGSATAAGFNNAFNFIPGMGTHHSFHGITAAVLHDPSFNRFDPVVPNSPVDGVFNPAYPEFLQYNGNTPSSVLVGMSWYVRTTNGLPPAGFAGNNDWWHHHPTLCLSNVTAEVVGVNTTDADCTPRNGTNTYMGNYYMLHTWQVDDLEYHGDVFAPMHPCIKSTGAIFNMSDPCHTSALRVAGRSSTESSAPATTMYCPLNQIETQWEADHPSAV